MGSFPWPRTREEVDAFEQGFQGLVEFVGRMILGPCVFQAFQARNLT